MPGMGLINHKFSWFNRLFYFVDKITVMVPIYLQ